ncbi:gp16 [Euproctis pseudoconspersa nucleopolyhedrovirus]|uniref:Gp16 n=1 Tax=Euproctis pseudoconspersa nucleopolyhedrovirus TaxID=307467 RepID=C3TX46_9ABAC|nr:gp16 [Euproctis pseudoconspersa nucleopolyhedrovirus]ACO53588.1 gp16 [Euproctis pseudoconspersa nucleopolyhedrovirus]
MNYSAALLVAVVVYLWYADSLVQEIATIKRLLVAVYDVMLVKFDSIATQLHDFQNATTQMLNSLHNSTAHTINLVIENGKKIDVINKKIDYIINR